MTPETHVHHWHVCESGDPHHDAGLICANCHAILYDEDANAELERLQASERDLATLRARLEAAQAREALSVKYWKARLEEAEKAYAWQVECVRREGGIMFPLDQAIAALKEPKP